MSALDPARGDPIGFEIRDFALSFSGEATKRPRWTRARTDSRHFTSPVSSHMHLVERP
ncbi:hypothetical protein AWB81_06248 [Caballeronia arationis]|jgi:hypothetical protein|uniref:Uncharacterized protein n=1 Tax=Caballeronia arationis TaxID=1777142 RepID=A0A7Z7N0V8_9BURK|nr:hypothetical protein AWB81_06248 [Caballeronia arationis]SOE54899.1 hypothetical protein SAMN05446927_0919 [Caballeronia arationis]